MTVGLGVEGKGTLCIHKNKPVGERQRHAPGVCQPPAHSGFVFSSGVENLGDYSYSVDDVIVLEIEVKGSAEPFQVLLEPYALIIPGESYIGITVKKDFKVILSSASLARVTLYLGVSVVKRELNRPHHGACSGLHSWIRLV